MEESTRQALTLCPLSLITCNWSCLYLLLWPNFTVPDHIIGNVIASTAMVSCKVEDEHPLNTSDHLPITSKLNLTLLSSTPATSDHAALNWTTAIRDVHTSQYAKLTYQGIAPFLSNDYSCIEEIESDIALVSKLLIDSSYSTIPTLHHSSNSSNRVYDPLLSSLCWQSRQAYREWKAPGSPRCGSLFEAFDTVEYPVLLSHLKKCGISGKTHQAMVFGYTLACSGR